MAGKQIFCSIAFPFLFIIFFFFLFPSNVANFTEGYTVCAPFKCGHLENITYPFFNSNQPDYCGHPQFKLDCKQNMLTIEINSTKFIVKNISKKSQTLTLSSYDLLALGTNCPKHLIDVSLDSPFFKYTSNNDNYTLLYDCKTLPPESPLNTVSSISYNCFSDGDLYSHQQYLVSSANVVKLSSMGCKNSFTIPILIEAFNESVRKNRHLEFVVSQGFEVKWSVVGRDKCDGCSGGKCGYNTSLNASMCLCPNQQSYGVICSETPTPSLSPHYEPHSEPEESHHALGKWKWEWKIIISVVSCLLAAVSLIKAIHFYRHCPKSYMQSHGVPSGPSPTDPEMGSRLFKAHLFTYAELEETTNNFGSFRELGRGGYGKVYFGKLRDGRCVAVKKLHESTCRRVELFMNEVQILTRLVHPNLVSLYGCTSRHNSELLLVYEYIPNGTLADHLYGKLANRGKLSWTTRMSIAVETANALKYLHTSEVVHRDVKTCNILLDNHFHVKVADFGLSYLFPNDATHVSTLPQGTMGYVDPEYHRYCQLTSKSDVYSFGVVLIELISSLPAIDHTRDVVNLAFMAIDKIQNQALGELVDATLGFESDCNIKKMICDVADLGFQCVQGSRNIRPSMNDGVDTLLCIQRDGNPP